jgi:hypothetical protein
MTDHTANVPVTAERTPVRVPRAEFRLYFALIFLLALPVALLTWTWTLVRTRRLPRLGPFARAFYDARAITPMIFAAP